MDTDEIVTECILVSLIREVSGVSFERGLHCMYKPCISEAEDMT